MGSWGSWPFGLSKPSKDKVDKDSSSKDKVDKDSSSKRNYTYHLSMLDFYTAYTDMSDKHIFMHNDQLEVAEAMMNLLLKYKTKELNRIIVKLKTVEDNNKIKTLLDCLHTLNHFRYLIETFDRFNDVPNSNDEKEILNSMEDYIKDKVNVAANKVVNSLIVFNPSEMDRLEIIDKFSFGEKNENSDTFDIRVARADQNMVGLLRWLIKYKNETKKFWNGYARQILDYKNQERGKTAQDYKQEEIDKYLEDIERDNKRDNTAPDRSPTAAIEAVIKDKWTYVVNGPRNKHWYIGKKGGRKIRGRGGKSIRVKSRKVGGVYRLTRKKK